MKTTGTTIKLGIVWLVLSVFTAADAGHPKCWAAGRAGSGCSGHTDAAAAERAAGCPHPTAGAVS